MKDELSRLDAQQAARRLLGCELVRTINGVRLVGRIVETESYEETDRSAHSFGGPRGRNLVMFGPAGYAYVYFTYGMHYCLNIVVGKEGRGEAVLVRAIEPIQGIVIMQQNRYPQKPALGTKRILHNITNGPAKLTQALAIDASFNGHYLSWKPLVLKLKKPLKPELITNTTRIGIRHNADYLQRFYITDNPWVSKP